MHVLQNLQGIKDCCANWKDKSHLKAIMKIAAKKKQV